MNKKLIVFIVVVFVAVVIGIVWWKGMSTSQSPKYTGPVEKIRLITSTSGPDLSSLIWIADAKGYFKDEGLDIATTEEATGVIAQEKVSSGAADIATDSDFGFVGDSFTLGNLRILASIDQPKVVDVVARRDSGINVPSDLKGKKIGVTSGIAPEFFFNDFLTSNNLSTSQVNIINIPITGLKDAITSGKVDAVAAIDPTSYDIKSALGGNGISWSAQPVQTFSWFIISSDQFLKAHSEAATRFLKSLVLAESFLKTNPEEGKQIVKNRLAEDQNYFNQNWPKHTFAVTLDQSSLITMEDEARWIIANKSTKKTVIPNYLDFIYFDALAKVKPEAVTIIH